MKYKVNRYLLNISKPICVSMLRFGLIIICTYLSIVFHSFNSAYAQETSGNSPRDHGLLRTSTDTIQTVIFHQTSLNPAPQIENASLKSVKKLIEQKQYREAIIQLDSTLNFNRENAFIWYYKGIAHLNLSEYNTALKCIRRAIKVQDNIFEFYLYHGIVNYEMGSYDQSFKSLIFAQSLAESAQQIDQKTEAVFWIGRLYHVQNDHSNAIMYYQQALELQPEFKEARKYLSDIKKDAWYLTAEKAFHLENWEQANLNYTKIYNIDSTFKDVSSKIIRIKTKLAAQALLDSALVAKSDNNYEKAKYFFDAALSTDPERKTEIQSLIDQMNRNQQGSDISSIDSSEVVGIPIKVDSVIAARHDISLTKETNVFKSNRKANWQWFNLKLIIFSSSMFLIIAIILLYLKLKKKRTDLASADSLPFPITVKSDWQSEFPRYSIKEEIGHGSTGHIYKAYDLKLERYVALKLIRFETEMDKDEVEERISRFLREVKMTANLNHPNIVNLYDYDKKDGIFYMTMELIEGESLKNVLKRNKQMEIKQAIEFLKQICSALEYAHKMNIIHRDIKPSNIIINTDGKIKLLDFGIAKIMNLTKAESCTLTGMRVGSPLYMSPEQINSQTVDVRSDIFSLGMVFYEMLIGESPYKINEGENLSRLFYLILNEKPATPSMIRKDIPSHIDSIIEKMLAKDPQNRYQTVSKIIHVLDSFQNST